MDEATEFNFDWTATLQIKVSPSSTPYDLSMLNSIKAPNSTNQVILYGKLEDNKINSLTRMFGRVPVENDRTCKSYVEPGLSFVGRIEDGIPVGVCWRGLIGGAWLYGEVDEIGEFTGDGIAYIYPDLKTALIGRFINGTMVSHILCVHSYLVRYPVLQWIIDDHE